MGRVNPGHRFGTLATLALTSLALPLAQSIDEQGPPGDDARAAFAALSGSPPQVQVEYFVLEQPGEPGTPLDLEAVPALEPRQAGLACWRRLAVDGGHQLEWDVVFPEQGTRVLHTERWTVAGSRLVWRELRAGSGRSLSAEDLEGGTGLRLREWAGRFRQALEIEAPGPYVLPLQLLELARRGALPPEGAWVFDPLARSFERVRPCEPAPGSSVDRERIDLLREDGTSAGSWIFDEGGLQAFGWQAGGLRARRISAEEYQRRQDSEAAEGGEAEQTPAPERAASGM